ncbi:unnamed protein product [Urochloa humidicola]
MRVGGAAVAGVTCGRSPGTELMTPDPPGEGQGAGGAAGRRPPPSCDARHRRRLHLSGVRSGLQWRPAMPRHVLRVWRRCTDRARGRRCGQRPAWSHAAGAHRWGEQCSSAVTTSPNHRLTSEHDRSGLASVRQQAAAPSRDLTSDRSEPVCHQPRLHHGCPVAACPSRDTWRASAG